eukprot:15342173-Ditylum_brightwellii.AAC.2
METPMDANMQDISLILHTATQGDHTYYKKKIRHPVEVEFAEYASSQLSRASTCSNHRALP